MNDHASGQVEGIQQIPSPQEMELVPRHARKNRDPFGSQHGPSTSIQALNLYFNIDEIPSPPPYSLKDNPRLLVDYWEGTITLNLYIHGTSIPLKYWRDLYAYNKPESWKIIKETWSRVRVYYPLLNYKSSSLTKILALLWSI